jgi:hypothetical protein
LQRRQTMAARALLPVRNDMRMQLPDSPQQVSAEPQVPTPTAWPNAQRAVHVSVQLSWLRPAVHCRA